MEKKITRRSFGVLMCGASLGAVPVLRASWGLPAFSASDSEGKTIYPLWNPCLSGTLFAAGAAPPGLSSLEALGFNMIKIQEVWADG